jgi:hypothetical protein
LIELASGDQKRCWDIRAGSGIHQQFSTESVSPARPDGPYHGPPIRPGLPATADDSSSTKPLHAGPPKGHDHPDLKNRILPREVSVFAHTDPICFLQDGRNVRAEASVAYLRKYVKGVSHWLGTEPPFANERDRREARRSAEEALRFYESL